MSNMEFRDWLLEHKLKKQGKAYCFRDSQKKKRWLNKWMVKTFYEIDSKAKKRR